MQCSAYIYCMQSPLDKLSKNELIQLILERDVRHEKVEKEYSKVQAEYEKTQTEYAKAQTEVTRLNYIIEKMKRMLFGSKRERFEVDKHQLNLSFDELEAKNEHSTDKPVKEVVSYTREVKKHNGRNKLPDTLPVHEVIIEPTEDTTNMVKIGEERTEILELAPAKFFKIVIIRPKYALPNNEGVVCGSLPSRPIDKCLAGNVLLAYILISKYVDHLPLYRLLQIFKRYGIIIAPSTIDGWIAKLGDLLEPLYNAMVNVVKMDGYIQVDETHIRVLDRTKKGKCHRGYYWVYHARQKRWWSLTTNPDAMPMHPATCLKTIKDTFKPTDIKHICNTVT